MHRRLLLTAVLADGLGMQPGSITVTDNGLVIGFVASRVGGKLQKPICY